MSRKLELEYGLGELNTALIVAGHEYFGFGMSLWGQEEAVSRAVQEALLKALEKDFFALDHRGLLTHADHREEIYRELFVQARAELAEGARYPELNFFSLPILQRAALYLRSRTTLPWDAIARIVGSEKVKVEVSDAREKLLGRKAFELDEDFF